MKKLRCRSGVPGPLRSRARGLTGRRAMRRLTALRALAPLRQPKEDRQWGRSVLSSSSRPQVQETEALTTDSRLLATRTAGGWIPSVLRVRKARACLGRCREKGRKGLGRVSRLQKGRKRILFRPERKPLPLQSLAPLREERRLHAKSSIDKCSI